MKTKQKAIRRIPPVSCLPPLDLSPNVEDMDFELQTFKRKQPVSDVMGLHACTESSSKKLCTDKSVLLANTRLQPLQMASNQKKMVTTTTTSASMAFTCKDTYPLSNTQIINLDQPNEADCVPNKSKGCNGISDLHNKDGQQPNRLSNITSSSEEHNHRMKVVSKVNGKRQRRISRKYVPTNNQITKAQSNTINHVPTISESVQRRNKRPRFTQVRQQDLHMENNNIHANTTQRRRMRQAREKMGNAKIPDFKIRLFGVAGSKQYNLPEGDCIRAIVFEGGPNVETNYDVIIEPRGGQPRRIDKLNPHYTSLHFPLLFIHGDEGYHLGLKLLALTIPDIKVLPASTDDEAQATATPITTTEADLEMNIPTAIPKIEPKTTTTPVQEQIDITESSSAKPEKKKTTTRRQLFQATTTDSETPSIKKSKKDD
ncbi:hypothetical protein CTI12_AA559560 [Artemisia annua]|uniref:Helitron helicase-like domain-containing protein n=1 Tax=Artemisia annua TaxID=35608 RepID=A0A2U1KVP6_ARTAN|nr:hypothetical protein CTI12_AA559560 [Artemisia annua]